MARAWCDEKGLHGRSAPPIGALLAAVVLVSGCATYRAPSTIPAIRDAQHATCDDFARGEVRRLGESVPAALARGVMIGLDADLFRLADVVNVRYPFESLKGERSPGTSIPPGVALLPAWAVGGFQLARDAGRTNEEVYEQAIQRCLAPIRLAQTFGPRDARVATSLELLADCYMRQREYAQAEPLRREALAIWEAVFGPNDSKVALALDDHATVLRHLHRATEADSLTHRAATIRAQLASRATPPPRDTHGPSVNLSCASPFSATLFVLCLHRDANADSHPRAIEP